MHNAPTSTPKNSERLDIFSTPGEFLQAVRSFPKATTGYYQYGFTRDSSSTALHKLEYGDATYVPAAEKIFNQLQAQGLFTHGQKIWDTDVTGAFPCIPNALMGLPDTMFNSVESSQLGQSTPIRVYIEVDTGGYLSETDIEKRGICLLAFVMSLQQMRPVELYAISVSNIDSDKGSYGSCVRIPTNPLDLDRASFMLCNAAYFREIGFQYAKNVGPQRPENRDGSYVGWSWGLEPSSKQYEDALRKQCQCEPHDIMLTGMSNDNREYILDPIKYIKSKLVDMGAQFND